LAGKTELDELEAQVSKLSAVERTRLTKRLIASLDEDEDIEEAFIAEFEHARNLLAGI